MFLKLPTHYLMNKKNFKKRLNSGKKLSIRIVGPNFPNLLVSEATFFITYLSYK